MLTPLTRVYIMNRAYFHHDYVIERRYELDEFKEFSKQKADT